MREFEPIGDRVLIRPADPDKFRAGIEFQGADIEQKYEGEVIAVGTGVPLHNIMLNITGETTPEAMALLLEAIKTIERGRAIQYQKGDYVLYGRYAGTKIHLDEVEHVIIREGDVFGKIR